MWGNSMVQNMSEVDNDAIEKIKAVLDEMRPMIHNHGGDIHFVRFENGVVYVALHGACNSCPISFVTLKMGIEARLKERIPGIVGVTEIEEE